MLSVRILVFVGDDAIWKKTRDVLNVTTFTGKGNE